MRSILASWTGAWRAVAPAILAITACVGPDIDYGEVRTFEVDRPEEGPYRIAAGDGLSIQFLYHPERNTVVKVRSDGKLSIPFAEEIQAEGLTIEELDKVLTESIEKHLRDADLLVVPTEQAQQRIFVAGEVKRSGELPLVPGMSLHQALSAAGWVTAKAAIDSVILIRQLEPGKREARKIDCSEDAMIAFDTQLHRFDMIYVPKSSIARIGEWVDNYLNETTPRWLQSIGTVVVIRETNTN